jgi:hypothetical protein
MNNIYVVRSACYFFILSLRRSQHKPHGEVPSRSHILNHPRPFLTAPADNRFIPLRIHFIIHPLTTMLTAPAGNSDSHKGLFYCGIFFTHRIHPLLPRSQQDPLGIHLTLLRKASTLMFTTATCTTAVFCQDTREVNLFPRGFCVYLVQSFELRRHVFITCH